MQSRATLDQVELVALDLEGSGAQDRHNEAILEIAVVPICDWRPDLAGAYHTLINPGRSIPHRPWISPGLTNTALQAAPPLAEVEPQLAGRINDRYLVGHNIGVDWRLLHRRCPTIDPTGLIDTLRIARRLRRDGGNGLRAIVTSYGLAEQVARAVPDSQPHRALWDTVAAALLLPELLAELLGRPPAASDLAAHVDQCRHSTLAEQASLFDST